MNVFVEPGIEVTVKRLLMCCHACGTRQLVPAEFGQSWADSHFLPQTTHAQVIMPDGAGLSWLPLAH